MLPPPGTIGRRRCAAADGSLLAGTAEGIFRTTDAGATWEPFLAGLPQQNGLHPPILVELVEQNGHALAGTAEHGILRTPLTALTAAPDAVVRADHALLRPNYPNPFNPRTTIAFTAASAGHAWPSTTSPAAWSASSWTAASPPARAR